MYSLFHASQEYFARDQAKFAEILCMVFKSVGAEKTC